MAMTMAQRVFDERLAWGMMILTGQGLQRDNV